MSDTLRALLGDKYEATIEKVTDAIAGFNDYLGCGCCTAYGYDESVARTGEDERPRMAAHDALAAVLPDLLAERDALAAKVAALADWHETKAEKARRFRIEIDGRNPVMDKAAEVHTDAARRLRAALDEEPQP